MYSVYCTEIMQKPSKKPNSKYNRVMPRVSSKTRGNSNPKYVVTRHNPPSARVGGKSSVSNSNLHSSVFSELPLVLDDYIPDEKPPRQTSVVKPKRTLKSLEPVKPSVSREQLSEVRKKRFSQVPVSAPSFLDEGTARWSDSHVRQCFSSRSHTKVEELKSEIKAYKEKEGLMRLRSQLLESCGVVLDEAGRVAEDKAVQAEGLDSSTADIRLQSIKRDSIACIEATERTRTRTLTLRLQNQNKPLLSKQKLWYDEKKNFKS